jgi:hypothetical protein
MRRAQSHSATAGTGVAGTAQPGLGLQDHRFSLKLSKDILNFRSNFAVRIRKRNDSRKDAKRAKFGENIKIVFFAPWRLGARIFFVEVILSKT